MPVSLKPIKRKKKTILDLETITKRAVREESRQALIDFRETVRTWVNKPKFFVRFTNDGYSAIVGTDDKVYGYVDKGTDPHPILPRGDYPLRFSSQFTPKTVVNVVGSKPGGSGERDVAARAVQHPGTEGRNFSKIIAEWSSNRMKLRMREAIRKGK